MHVNYKNMARINSVGITQNKTTVFDRKLSFYFGLRPDAAGLAPFYHLTAEVNSAYDNFPFHSELTHDDPRQPEGGICFYPRRLPPKRFFIHAPHK